MWKIRKTIKNHRQSIYGNIHWYLLFFANSCLWNIEFIYNTKMALTFEYILVQTASEKSLIAIIGNRHYRHRVILFFAPVNDYIIFYFTPYYAISTLWRTSILYEILQPSKNSLRPIFPQSSHCNGIYFLYCLSILKHAFSLV